mmetsp:Transcript_4023/g.6185  ORF Transcript_4023/g.6185 Transcript_4023/m.6185 type:complete len:333 (+) Transcript_4023:205-1203(+)
MAPKAICGNLITSRRSFLALAWTLTTCLSLFSFIVAIFLATRISQQYTEYRDEYGNRYLEEGGEGNSGDREGEGHSNDERDEDFFSSLTHNSRGLLFASVYTTILGLGLSLYGSTVVIGFMSLVGEYIPPCFTFRSMSMEEEDPSTVDPALGPRKLWTEKIHRGIFLGSLVIFSNLLILCAVIFGELQVNSNYNNDDDSNLFESMFSYRVERITSVFAATCLMLAFLYIFFAVIYLTCGGMSDDDDAIASYPSSPTSRGILENQLFEMPTKKRRRRKHRREKSMDQSKQEPLVEGETMIPPVGITENEGFITGVDGYSNESSSSWNNLPELT